MRQFSGVRFLPPLLLAGLLFPAGPAALGAGAARLTAAERAQGWKLLFDGRSLRDWRGYGLDAAPATWRVEEGELRAGGEPALVSEEFFKDFELIFDWQVEAGGRAAVHFRIGDEDLPLSLGGVVFELAGPESEPGGNGGLQAPVRSAAPEPGRWHTARLVVFGQRVEYWVNGAQVNSFTVDGREWRAAVASSRFQVVQGYGLDRNGPLALSGDGARFKNIRARPL